MSDTKLVEELLEDGELGLERLDMSCPYRGAMACVGIVYGFIGKCGEAYAAAGHSL